MGEIKSTLDIIMNKVKNINVSPEEKRIWKDKEIRKKADSMLEKLLSNQIKLYQFEDEVEKISQEDKKSLVGFLMDGLLNRVQIYNTPEEVFSALSVFLKNKSEDIIISRIKSQISLYEKKVHKRKEEISKEILENLKLKGISGSAVVPNLASSDVWKSFLEKVEQEFSSQKELIKKEFF